MKDSFCLGALIVIIHSPRIQNDFMKYLQVIVDTVVKSLGKLSKGDLVIGLYISVSIG